ncbi:MAG: hypothetical protein IT373_23865, partial [Polyangiaceae bacterium]|nr:hypothetical protein [Polyangiaceae bacterium]
MKDQESAGQAPHAGSPPADGAGRPISGFGADQARGYVPPTTVPTSKAPAVLTEQKVVIGGMPATPQIDPAASQTGTTPVAAAPVGPSGYATPTPAHAQPGAAAAATPFDLGLPFVRPAAQPAAAAPAPQAGYGAPGSPYVQHAPQAGHPQPPQPSYPGGAPAAGPAPSAPGYPPAPAPQAQGGFTAQAAAAAPGFAPSPYTQQMASTPYGAPTPQPVAPQYASPPVAAPSAYVAPAALPS